MCGHWPRNSRANSPWAESCRALSQRDLPSWYVVTSVFVIVTVPGTMAVGRRSGLVGRLRPQEQWPLCLVKCSREASVTEDQGLCSLGAG